MEGREIETFYDPSRKRRAILYERRDGSYGFQVERYSDDLLEAFWIPQPGYSISFFDSIDTARRELQGRVSWLRDQP